MWFEIYKKCDDVLHEAFVGFQSKKTKFAEKIKKEFLSNTSKIIPYEMLLDNAKIIFGDSPEKLTLIENFDITKLCSIEKSELWKKKIVGKSDVEIAPMIQKLGLSDWVNQGVSYIGEDSTCPFCQEKTITEKLIKQFESYFDATYKNNLNELDQLITQHKHETTNILHLLETIIKDQESLPNSKLKLETFKLLLKTLHAQVLRNNSSIENKKKEPSRSIDVFSYRDILEQFQILISDCNVEVKKHNDMVSDLKNQKAILTCQVWKYLVDKHKVILESKFKDIKNLNNAITGVKESLQKQKNKKDELDNLIKEATKNITSVQPAIDSINKVLRFYGCTNFKIVESKTNPNHYQIEREDGTRAETTLSEGESTFITFLYFMELANGSVSADAISTDRILVIDDPISSLDSNIMFVVSSLIKNVMVNINQKVGIVKQLIVLTHNVYFHKEVSYGCSKISNAYFWIIRKNNNLSEIIPYERENPIHSSYQLLWKEIKLNSSDNDYCLSTISLQNTMRRIIENYFKILGKYTDNSIIYKFTDQGEQLICRSLLCWVNDGSHCITDDTSVEQFGLEPQRYLNVFKKIFVVMGHEEHYSMMMEES